MTQSLPDDFESDSVVPELQQADAPKRVPDGWTRLSGKIQGVKKEVEQLLPGRQMTREELEAEMEEARRPTKDGKRKFISGVEKLPER